MVKESGRKLITVNRRARHDYAISDTYECGLVLTGTEVKSLRAGKANLTDAYAEVRDGEVWLVNAFIPEYDQGTWTNHEPRRTRKLLLHSHEISRLIGKTKQSGLTLVPMQMYFSDGKAKVEIGLGKGKKAYDKRQDIAERQAKRDADRAVAAARRSR
jgi:SsrA-binding protein